MSFHYNEAFEDPDYHHSETLEIDKIKPFQQHSTFHHNPYASSPHDSYEDYSREGTQRQNAPVLIPMNSMQLQSDTEYNQRDFAFDRPRANPYGNAHINPSFESGAEADFIQMPPFTISPPGGLYGHRLSDSTDGVNFLQRHNRYRADTVFMTPSSLLQLDPEYKERQQKEEEKFISDLSVMSTRERIKAIQKIPKTMKEKRMIRKSVLMERTKKSHRRGMQIKHCTQCCYNMALSFRRLKNGLQDCFQLLKAWQKILKDISGKFGTSVHSYFLFLTWLLMFNVFSFFVNFSFIAIPQLLVARPNNLSFTGLEFFTGAGYFKDTVLYYGFYTNATVSKNTGLPPYYMQLAYIFTIGIYFIVCFLSLLYSMAKSFRNNFINPQMFAGNAARLLCVWDFSVTNEKAVKLKQKNLSTQIKEALSEMDTAALEVPLSKKIARFAVHLVFWAVSLGASAGSSAGIYYYSLNNLEFFLGGNKTELEREAATLVLPVVLSVLNRLVPFLFSFFSLVEKFSSPKHQIYTAIIRNLILKTSIIGVLCYYWLQEVAGSNAECWETLVGQDIYRLLVADFICSLLGSFFGEFLRRIIGTKCCRSLGVPEFDIAGNVLDLIYVQTLAWIGIFFSPLLPAIQMICYFIIFFVKKVSLMMNCQPPRRAWRASQMNTLFVFLLFFPSFTGVLCVIAVTVWRLKPSKTCGPFRGLTSIFEAISGWVAVLTSYPGSGWVVWIYHNLVESVHFFFILSILVLIITYVYWQIIDGRKIMVKLLQQQIVNEGKDKMFLLKKLRTLQAPKDLNPEGHLERISPAHPHLRQRQQARVSLPRSVESSPGTKRKTSYSEASQIPGMTTFSHAKEMPQPARDAGVSEAFALVLRARQEIEWEMENEASS
uniref:Transmembrane channel-like protein n=1 Tax=Salvator merianae TaxID=96440 RepID=A0A8D0AZG4_SALMN